MQWLGHEPGGEGAEMLAETLMALAALAGQHGGGRCYHRRVGGGQARVRPAAGPRRPGAGPSWRSSGWRRHASSSPERQGAGSGAGPRGAGGALGGRLADLLEEDPDAEADLRALVQQIQAALPAGMVSAADHAVAAGRDVNISASGGGVAAGVIHGNVAPPDPTRPGPANT